MLLQALLTAEDVTAALADITPLRLALDDESEDRYFWLGTPSAVTFVAGEGVRIVTNARLQWDVVGIPLPVTIRMAQVLLRPSIERVDGQDVLRLKGEVERLDLSSVPSLVEAPIISALNTKLAQSDATVSWKFMETLDFDFKMPASVDPLETIRLFASSGEARMGEKALVLQVGLGFSATHRESSRFSAPPEITAAAEPAPPLPPA